MSTPVPRTRKRSRARVLAPAVIPLVLGAAVAVPWVLWGSTASSPPGAGVRPATASPPGGGRTPARAASTAVDTSGWRAAEVDGAPVPESPSSGPYHVSGGTASGYADTPAGAVLAAVNIAVRVSGQDGPAVFSRTIASQVTGTWQQTLLAAAWQEYQQSGTRPSDGGPSAGADVSVSAVRITSWSPSAADVTLLATADSASYEQLEIPVQVTWSGGDWRLVAPASGQFPATPVAPGLPAKFTRLPARPSAPPAGRSPERRTR